MHYLSNKIRDFGILRGFWCKNQFFSIEIVLYTLYINISSVDTRTSNEIILLFFSSQIVIYYDVLFVYCMMNEIMLPLQTSAGARNAPLETRQ